MCCNTARYHLNRHDDWRHAQLLPAANEVFHLGFAAGYTLVHAERSHMECSVEYDTESEIDYVFFALKMHCTPPRRLLSHPPHYAYLHCLGFKVWV